MSWFKLMGTVFIIAGFGTWGLSGAKAIEKRTGELIELKFALGFLEKEITYLQTPLSRAMEKTASMCQPPVSGLFKEVARQLKAGKGLTAAEAWVQGLEKNRTILNLKDADIELLAAAANQLGMTDTTEQRKFFIMLQEQLKIQEEKARQEQAANQKLWSYGGFILGAVIVLLLL